VGEDNPNLVSNAFKFTLQGSITVRLVEIDRQAKLTLEDTGVGIPSEELPYILERFHRIEHSRGRTRYGYRACVGAGTRQIAWRRDRGHEFCR
jgi:signal transduction histidine kinase